MRHFIIDEPEREYPGKVKINSFGSLCEGVWRAEAERAMVAAVADMAAKWLVDQIFDKHGDTGKRLRRRSRRLRRGWIKI